MRMHVGGAVAHWGLNYPEKKAVTVGSLTQTYGEILAAMDRLTTLMSEEDVVHGDRIGIVCPTSHEYVQLLYACLRMGGVAVPLDFGLTAQQVARTVQDASCRLLFVHDAHPEVQSMGLCCASSMPPDSIITWQHQCSASDLLKNRSLSSLARSSPRQDHIHFDDQFGILYSSGTTGTPKGIVKTHYQIISELIVWITELHIGFEDVLLVTTPFYYTGGLLLLLAGMFVGAHVVSVEPTVSARDWYRHVKEFGVTHAFLTPSQTRRILTAGQDIGEPTPTLRTILTMSDVTTGAMKMALARRFHCEVVDAWGNTEGVGTITKGRDLEARPDSIGKPFLTDEVRIVDEQFHEVGPGIIGEIIGKTDSDFVEYRGRPDLTRETIRDGWILSGDLGWKDEEGYLYFAGRKKDIMKVRGATIYAQDIERVLERHPMVRQASVFAIEDEDTGDQPVGAVLATEGGNISSQDLLNWANGHLSVNQHLHDVLVCTEFPRTPAGKVIKQKLLELYLERREAGEVGQNKTRTA